MILAFINWRAGGPGRQAVERAFNALKLLLILVSVILVRACELLDKEVVKSGSDNGIFIPLNSFQLFYSYYILYVVIRMILFRLLIILEPIILVYISFVSVSLLYAANDV